ncbi:MAG: hypothetical protein K0Q50_726 [Vampirovibrio sp.]|jgi:hypothetical protein|nr:hypothetical protein [Vampirovibrio sp.]
MKKPATKNNKAKMPKVKGKNLGKAPVMMELNMGKMPKGRKK